MNYSENIKQIHSEYQNREKVEFNPHNKFKYIVPMFPYPSGKIHMGHIRNYTISNVVANYYRNKGHQVFHPIGFDSFGMPAENAAIKNGVSPSAWTEQNIEQMINDFKKVGFNFDWEHSIQTHKFDYYKFEQDIFKRAFEEGIIYKKSQYVNFDPEDNTVLSNEQVINGKGWRTGAQVIRKKIPMYFFNMKKYGQRLHEGLNECTQWPKRVIEMQKNWIGYEEGTYFTFAFSRFPSISVFSSPKIKEANSIIVGINHPWVENFENKDSYQKWINTSSSGSVSMKDNFNKKIQFNTEYAVVIGKKTIPIVIDMMGDTEAVFSAQVVESHNVPMIGEIEDTFDGIFIGLRDWCISRQRYWGNPIPVINCNACGDVVSDDYVQLPVDMIPDGRGNVLERNEDFVSCICPKCNQPAKRYTDTMDTFVQSSWYFHRYISPNAQEMIEFPDTQIDHYIGGVEHATMHLIYTRFFHKMLKDFGMVSTEEPIKKLTTQGMVCKKYTKPDGSIASAKMSKSIGNIVEPNEYIEKYGSDALQMFMIFAAPPDQNFDFEDAGIVGTYRFLDEVHQYFFGTNNAVKNIDEITCIEQINKMEKYIENEFERRFNLNTIVPQIMIAFKSMKKTNFINEEVKKDIENRFVKQLSIVAPQISYFIQKRHGKENDFDVKNQEHSFHSNVKKRLN